MEGPRGIHVECTVTAGPSRDGNSGGTPATRILSDSPVVGGDENNIQPSTSKSVSVGQIEDFFVAEPLEKAWPRRTHKRKWASVASTSACEHGTPTELLDSSSSAMLDFSQTPRPTPQSVRSQEIHGLNYGSENDDSEDDEISVWDRRMGEQAGSDDEDGRVTPPSVPSSFTNVGDTDIACVCERRIFNGTYTPFDKQFMVYFVQSEMSAKKSTALGNYWLCGGAIVSPTQILTSAACLKEHDHIYAIAGYKKYVNRFGLDKDQCTKRWKQKVIRTCTPKEYRFNHDKPINWISMDVGVAIVEKPFNFSDLTWRLYCSYTPAPIRVLYEEEYQVPGISVLMFGWGSEAERQPHDILDPNSPFLREASGKIITKGTCRNSLNGILMAEVVDKFLICVQGKGILGGAGELLDLGELNNAGCSRKNMNDARCANNSFYDDEYFEFRRNSNRTDTIDETVQQNRSSENVVNTRRQGICQNDHGGPLVTWLGNEEVMIGVAATALHGSRYECVGPSLFSSTHCTSSVIQCLLLTDVNLRRKCEAEEKAKGITITDQYFDWDNLNGKRSPSTVDLPVRMVVPLRLKESSLSKALPQQIKPLPLPLPPVQPVSPAKTLPLVKALPSAKSLPLVKSLPSAKHFSPVKSEPTFKPISLIAPRRPSLPVRPEAQQRPRVLMNSNGEKVINYMNVIKNI